MGGLVQDSQAGTFKPEALDAVLVDHGNKVQDGDIGKVATAAVNYLKSINTPMELGGETLVFEVAQLQVQLAARHYRC